MQLHSRAAHALYCQGQALTRSTHHSNARPLAARRPLTRWASRHATTAASLRLPAPRPARATAPPASQTRGERRSGCYSLPVARSQHRQLTASMYLRCLTIHMHLLPAGMHTPSAAWRAAAASRAPPPPPGAPAAGSPTGSRRPRRRASAASGAQLVTQTASRAACLAAAAGAAAAAAAAQAAAAGDAIINERYAWWGGGATAPRGHCRARAVSRVCLTTAALRHALAVA